MIYDGQTDETKIRAFFVTVLMFFLASCGHTSNSLEAELLREQQQTQEAERAISEQPVYREINDLCNTIQKPDSFVLVFKRMSFRAKDPYLTFGYSSPMAFDEAQKFFLNLENHGWEAYDRGPSVRSKLIKFKKDKYRFDVEYYGDTEHGNYLIGCQKMDE